MLKRIFLLLMLFEKTICCSDGFKNLSKNNFYCLGGYMISMISMISIAQVVYTDAQVVYAD